MNVFEKRVENQVHFWSLIGPFIILLSIAVLLYKLSSHWYFPLSTLIGIPLCVKWKMKGMAAALAGLFTFSFIGYQSLEVDERFWHVGMSLALAFSFIILTLSLEEVEGLIDTLQNESKSRLENYTRLSEELKTAEIEWVGEKERLTGQVLALSRDLVTANEERYVQHKLAHLSKDELIQLRNQHATLIENFNYKKIELLHLNEKLEVAELTVQNFVNSDSEKTIEALRQSIASLEEEKLGTQQALKVASDKWAACQLEREQANHERLACKQQEQRLFAELAEQKKYVQTLAQASDKLSIDKNLLEASHSRLQRQFDELAGVHSLAQKQEERVKNVEGQLAIKEYEIEQILKNNKLLSQQFVQKENEFQQLFQLNQELENQLYTHMVKWQAEQAQHQEDKKASLDKEEACQALKNELALKETIIQEHQALLQKEKECHSQFISELQQMKKGAEKLREELASYQQTKSQETDRLQIDFECKLAAKEEALQKISQECHLLNEKVNECQMKVEDSPAALREIEAKYAQLRQQFQEKSKVLDQTRKELFEIEEKRLALLIEREENENFALSPYEELLQNELIRQGAELEACEEEIALLSQIIENILKTPS